MTLLKALDALLSFIVEDAVAHKLIDIPEPLFKKLEEASIALEDYISPLEDD